MPWTLSHLEDKGIILVQTSGKHDLYSLTEMVKVVGEKFREYQCGKCLIDHRKADVSMKTLPSYKRPQLYNEIGFSHNQKGAILFKELSDDHRFYENACQNRGWNVRVFDDYEEALKWLEN